MGGGKTALFTMTKVYQKKYLTKEEQAKKDPNVAEFLCSYDNCKKRIMFPTEHNWKCSFHEMVCLELQKQKTADLSK